MDDWRGTAQKIEGRGEHDRPDQTDHGTWEKAGQCWLAARRLPPGCGGWASASSSLFFFFHAHLIGMEPERTGTDSRPEDGTIINPQAPHPRNLLLASSLPLSVLSLFQIRFHCLILTISTVTRPLTSHVRIQSHRRLTQQGWVCVPCVHVLHTGCHMSFRWPPSSSNPRPRRCSDVRLVRYVPRSPTHSSSGTRHQQGLDA